MIGWRAMRGDERRCGAMRGDASRGKDIRWVNRRAAKWTPSLVHNASNPQKAVRDGGGGEENMSDDSRGHSEKRR